LLEIQNRVLPVGRTVNGVLVVDDNTRVPLYLSTRRWATVNLRMGVPVGERMQVMGALENLLDRNYRWHGSGMDAAGFNAYVAVRWGW
jgi:outer membrane receptor protein involved in Fe transport